MKEQVFKMMPINISNLNKIGETSLAINMEMIKTRSGEWYSVSQNDIGVFVAETKRILQRHIVSGNIIGLFLDLDNAHFGSMILYHACAACGASVIRCGISDFKRQLPIKNDMDLDLLICTKTVQKYIINKVKYKKCILVDYIENIEGQLSPYDELDIYELFNIPGFIVKDSETIFCPGYTISECHDLENAICINSCKEIEGFEVYDYHLNLSFLPTFISEQSLDIVHSYIKLQIRIMMKDILNGKIDCKENINLNSIGMVELLVRIEEEFGISIPMEEISKTRFENLISVSDLVYSTIMENQG